MVLFRRFIIGLCGGEFIIETAEPDSFPVEDDFGDPSAGAFFEIDADEGRRSFQGGLGLIELVL